MWLFHVLTCSKMLILAVVDVEVVPVVVGQPTLENLKKCMRDALAMALLGIQKKNLLKLVAVPFVFAFAIVVAGTVVGCLDVHHLIDYGE